MDMLVRASLGELTVSAQVKVRCKRFRWDTGVRWTAQVPHHVFDAFTPFNAAWTSLRL